MDKRKNRKFRVKISSSDNKPNLANKLKTIRKNLDKTQEELAREIGLTRTAYGKYEAGKTYPSFATMESYVKTIKKIAPEIHLNDGFFLGDDRMSYITDDNLKNIGLTVLAINNLKCLTTSAEYAVPNKEKIAESGIDYSLALMEMVDDKKYHRLPPEHIITKGELCIEPLNTFLECPQFVDSFYYLCKALHDAKNVDDNYFIWKVENFIRDISRAFINSWKQKNKLEP